MSISQSAPPPTIPLSDDYPAELLRHAEARTDRLSSDRASEYRKQYAEAAQLGARLRAWRSRHNLDRTAAASKLPGWPRTSIALLEQGLLIPDELTSEMRKSLQLALD